MLYIPVLRFPADYSRLVWLDIIMYMYDTTKLHCIGYYICLPTHASQYRSFGFGFRITILDDGRMSYLDT